MLRIKGDEAIDRASEWEITKKKPNSTEFTQIYTTKQNNRNNKCIQPQKQKKKTGQVSK